MSETFSKMKINPDLVAAIKEFKDNLLLHSEMVILQAKLHKEKFDACKAEGFSDTQSLELCKKIFLE